MKEIELEAVVEDCTVQSYFDAIYADETATRIFHSEVNGDANATAAPWGADGQRSVSFVMPMNVPAFLKRLIGLDSLPVTEAQRLEWAADRSSFKLVSEPILNFPGANKFTTSGCLEVCSRPGGACHVKIVMTCAAAMPWPLNNQVEATMATEAVNSITIFLEWCKKYYARWRAEQREVPERPAPRASGPRPAAAAAEGGEQFYDAYEDEADLQRPTGQAGEGEEEETSVVPYQPPRLEDVIVDCLRKIQSSTADTAASLRNLEVMIRNMDDNMQVLRDKLAGKRPQRQQQQPVPSASSHTGPGGRAPATTATASTARTSAPSAPAPSKPSSSTTPSPSPSSALSGYMGALAAVSLVCGVGAVTYMRYRQAAGGGSSGGSGK